MFVWASYLIRECEQKHGNGLADVNAIKNYCVTGLRKDLWLRSELITLTCLFDPGLRLCLIGGASQRAGNDLLLCHSMVQLKTIFLTQAFVLI